MTAQPPRAGLPLSRRLAIMAASGLATLAVAFMLFALWSLWLFGAPGPLKANKDVLLRQGASLPEIAATLEQEGVIRSSSVFMAASQVSGASRALKAGEYAFPAHVSIADVLELIRSGKVVRHFVTIPEGRTAEQAIDILMASDVLTGSAPVPEEGSILPETYEVRRGEDRAAVLARMEAAQDELMAQLWPKRQPNLPFTTQKEALTLASIVEKETGLARERPRIAAVFVNRLRKGMRLESDPTIIYGISKGRPLGRGIRQSELMTPTPYNTYFIAGLPPTPIANPGRSAIAAVLDPPQTSELFFVADGSGGHVFSSTFEEHTRNVAKWRRVEAVAAAQPAAPAPAGLR